jgi:hypothetical protein
VLLADLRTPEASRTVEEPSNDTVEVIVGVTLRWDDAAVLISLPTGEPLGRFHAVRTRDGEALAHDGQAYFALNALESSSGKQAVVEIQFADGSWMLAEPEDLEPRMVVEGQ